MFASLEMPPSAGFWSRPALLGFCDDEIISNRAKTLEAGRAAQLEMALTLGANALFYRIPEGCC